MCGGHTRRSGVHSSGFRCAADLGTGTWTTLAQVAADSLGVDVEDVTMRIGDTRYPTASVAGGSSGMTTWAARS